MTAIEDRIGQAVIQAIEHLYGKQADSSLVQIQKTRKEFEGDLTVVVFPLLRYSAKSPEQTAGELGKHLNDTLEEVSGFNVIKGFLNITISDHYWIEHLSVEQRKESFGEQEADDSKPAVMVEFSSPNTNKPLHLGHIRNILLGHSVSRIMEAAGKQVVKVNLVNDRGIHICKSMLAWEKFGNGETPESSGKKGDHLIGDYYVKFDREYKMELAQLREKGLSEEEAEKESQLMEEAREMLRKWEAGDPHTVKLWEMMNGWVYEGFDITYDRLGVAFDKIYYESETYKMGKELVLKGLQSGVLYEKEDGSVWADLTAEGLDNKLLLRSDGTSVYMTQDLGTAHQRFSEYNLDKHIYVVGNEQNYHFQVLATILKKMGYEWADKIYHLSYGMVELPEGKMKSREGTVVDADDIIDEMVATAKKMAEELGKLDEIPPENRAYIHYQIGMAALKYFILKVDPKKNMTFNPAESIDFNGNTGPFIQYTYARIQSVLRKYGREIPAQGELRESLNEKEKSLVRLLYDFPEVVKTAAGESNPSVVANYLYELAREFNQFYHDHSILNADEESTRYTRLLLSDVSGRVIRKGMYLLGIDVPERM